MLISLSLLCLNVDHCYACMLISLITVMLTFDMIHVKGSVHHHGYMRLCVNCHGLMVNVKDVIIPRCPGYLMGRNFVLSMVHHGLTRLP